MIIKRLKVLDFLSLWERVRERAERKKS